MYKFQEIFENTISDIVASGYHNRSLQHLEDGIKAIVPDLAEDLAQRMLKDITSDAATRREVRKGKRRFEKRHKRLWKEPLQTLELFITIATEAGADFNSTFRTEAARSGDAVFEALTRLHSRACQVSSEIFVLLSSGFADGAHARWRSLHEIAVVGLFIGQHGQEVAERYLLHDAVQRYKSASQYQKYAEKIDYEPLTDAEFNLIKSSRDQLVERFGRPFGSDYGWAAAILGGANPGIRDIEEHVEMNHMRPYYRWASDNVHPNSHGSYHRLGMDPNADEVLLAGPSNFGLADPGHGAAFSLYQVTTVLLVTRSSLDCIVVLKILEMLMDEVGDAFLDVHQRLQSSSHHDAFEPSV